MQDKWIVLVFVVCIVVFAAVGKSKPKALAHRFIRRGLMTPRELEFFERLRGQLPDVLIHPQVAMSAVVDVKGGTRAGRNVFDKKVLDFVVCDRFGNVLYAIELDDKSHASASARRRDVVKDDVAKAAGLHLLRYSSIKTPAEQLRRDFEAVVGRDAAR
jgi:hypothetical protein